MNDTVVGCVDAGIGAVEEALGMSSWIAWRRGLGHVGEIAVAGSEGHGDGVVAAPGARP